MTSQDQSSATALEGARGQKQSFWRQLVDFLVMLAIAAVLAFLIQTFLVQPFKIPSGSMEPTLMVGDRVLANKLVCYFRPPKDGEIVTFKNPDKNDTTENILIKRVIATQGQTVDIKDGKVYVDGKALNEPYVHGQKTVIPFEGASASNYPYEVPSGYMWVMGDNRNNSLDSRLFGPQPVANVTGHAFFIYWPISRMGPLE